MDLRRLRTELRVFAAAINVALEEFQAEALSLVTLISVIVAPRQSGKSRSLAVLALWRAFCEPNHRVLIVSAGEEASRRLLAEIRAIVAASELLSGSLVDEQAGLVRLSNGSEIRSVPASERQIRGWSVDTLLVDEAALVPGPLWSAAIPTIAARPGARIVLASSATTAAGDFYDFAVRGERGSEHVRTCRWRLEQCHWISPSVIAAARETMSDIRFRAEFLGEFAGDADSLFLLPVLQAVLADFLPDRLEGLFGPARVLAGADWGATRDRSAFAAIGRLAVEGMFAVRCAHAWQSGHPLHGVVGEMVGSPAHYDIFSSEGNGIGEGCTQMTWTGLLARSFSAGGGVRRPRAAVMVNEGGEHGGDPFSASERPPRRGPEAGFVTERRRVYTSARMKAATWSSIRLLVDRGLLWIPSSATELIRELLMLRVDLGATGVERIEAGQGHDDIADAFALACTPYRRPGEKNWRLLTADLAEAQARGRLPKPMVPAAVTAGETVPGPGGVPVLRRPAWASVRGPEVTLPPGVDLTSPGLRALREQVQVAGQSTTSRGGHLNG